MVKRIVKNLLAVSLVLVMLCSCGTSHSNKYMDLGAKYLKELDYDSAIEAYTSAIEVDPLSIDAHVGLAKAYQAKASSVDDTRESLDSLVLAWNTLNDMLEDGDTQYEGEEETIESAADLRVQIESEFSELYFQELYSLNCNTEGWEEINSFRDNYQSYVYDFIDLQESKTIDEIDLSEESKEAYDSFLNDGSVAVFHLADGSQDGTIDLDDYLENNAEYSLSDILDVYNNIENVTLGDITTSYIDCGKDNDYEMLVCIDYTYEPNPGIVNYNTASLVIKPIKSKLEVCYHVDGRETHFVSDAGDEVYTAPSMIYNNGLVYSCTETGSSPVCYEYSVGYIDEDGTYNLWYEFEEEYIDEEECRVSDNVIRTADDEYYYLTVGYTDVMSGYKPLQILDFRVDASQAYADDFNDALLEIGDKHPITSFSDVINIIQERRLEIGLTDSIYYK